MLDKDIAAKLEIAFSQHGFAQPSVAQLKTECQVSLRTLYKYYPSKDEMIVAALSFRHERYLDFLSADVSELGGAAIGQVFDKLEIWMKDYAPYGCLSMNAMAAYPENIMIQKAVKQHKREVRDFLGKLSARSDLATPLFILHEGVASAWPTLGKVAMASVKQTLISLFKEKAI
ncbi:TetR/AcrR family transcriptional regulator [Marinomonas sp.]